MSAINSQPKKSTDKRSILLVGGIIAVIASLLFAYLLFYTSPEHNMEMVKVIAITENGCIAETMDGYSVNIGDCKFQPGQYVDVLVDQKVKERAALMNPTQ